MFEESEQFTRPPPLRKKYLVNSDDQSLKNKPTTGSSTLMNEVLKARLQKPDRDKPSGEKIEEAKGAVTKKPESKNSKYDEIPSYISDSYL